MKLSLIVTDSVLSPDAGLPAINIEGTWEEGLALQKFLKSHLIATRLQTTESLPDLSFLEGVK